jgi:hypothetical protein
MIKRLFLTLIVLVSANLYSQDPDRYRLNHKVEPVYQLFPERERSKILNKKISVKTEELKRRKVLKELYKDEVNQYLREFRKNH